MIRRLTEKDRDIYLEMAEEFYHSDAVLHPVPRSYMEATVDEALRSARYTNIYIIESEGGACAGYGVTARTFSQEAGGFVTWIEELYIREAFRSKGLGREFFSYIEEDGKGDTARLRLEVEADNTGAVALYEKLGFHIFDYVQMVKDC